MFYKDIHMLDYVRRIVGLILVFCILRISDLSHAITPVPVILQYYDSQDMIFTLHINVALSLSLYPDISIKTIQPAEKVSPRRPWN